VTPDELRALKDARLIALAPDLASLLADLMDYTNALIEGEWGFYPTLERSFDDHRPLLARFQALGDKS